MKTRQLHPVLEPLDSELLVQTVYVYEWRDGAWRRRWDGSRRWHVGDGPRVPRSGTKTETGVVRTRPCWWNNGTDEVQALEAPPGCVKGRCGVRKNRWYVKKAHRDLIDINK
jgi:hypothetical protein